MERVVFRYLIILILLHYFNKTQAQFTNNFWVFGDSCGINWTNPQSPSLFHKNFNGRGSFASLSDTSLLLNYAYTRSNISALNTTLLFNRYGDTVENGSDIVGEAWYHELVFIPIGGDSLVYLFSIGVTGSSLYGLYYTLINYKANNDSGVVIQKNVQLNSFPAFDGLTAIKHGNGRDWWLVFQRWYAPLGAGATNDYYIYYISPNGINSVPVQNIGPTHKTNAGQLFFNSTGDKLGVVTFSGMFSVLSFDRCTGVLSSPITIETERLAPPYPYLVSGVFSLDGSKVYVMADARSNMFGTVDTLYQYDLNSTNINGSKQIIYNHPSVDVAGGALKLAPDGKIYLASGDESASIPYPDSLYTLYNTHLSVINHPDSLGLACDFQPFSFYLGGARTYYGLPNNPDYELGAWVGSPCDTLSVGVDDFQPPKQTFFQAWYNSEWNMIHVNASKLKGRTGSLRLFDMEGRLVYERKIEVIAGGYVTGEIPMNGVVNGVCLVNLITDSESVSSKIVKF